jgi:hypothetical protein
MCALLIGRQEPSLVFCHPDLARAIKPVAQAALADLQEVLPLLHQATGTPHRNGRDDDDDEVRWLVGALKGGGNRRRRHYA